MSGFNKIGIQVPLALTKNKTTPNTSKFFENVIKLYIY